MDQHTLGRLFWAFVVVAIAVGVPLIVRGSPLVAGFGVMLLVLGIISILPAIVLSWGGTAS